VLHRPPRTGRPSAVWSSFRLLPVGAGSWQPGSPTFYYDGVEVGRQTSGVTSSAHYVIANLAVSGSEIAVPQTMKVDYVRVWKPA